MFNTSSFTHNDYQISQKEILFQGNFLSLARYTLKHRLFNGNWSNTFQCEVLERKSAVAILPYDPLLDRVILIEQFRPGTLSDSQNPWLIEVPAGVIEKNETLEEVASREIKEEVGCEAMTLHPMCDFFVSPGGANEYLNLYCGRVDARTIAGTHGLSEENEDIRVINLTAEEAFAELKAGHIKTAPALIALMWLQLHKEKLQKIWL